MKSFSCSADYIYLDIALKSLWPSFVDIVAEMDAFKPHPISEYDEHRKRMLQHYHSQNPARCNETLAKFVDSQIAFMSKERLQFVNLFSNRFMAQYVIVVMLSHALCEATINAILAQGLAKSNSQKLFSSLELKDITEKWQNGPKSFHPKYELAAGRSLFETLRCLQKLRNALVHYKIHVFEGTKSILRGSKVERCSFKENTRWMRRFFSLPYDLSEHATIQLKDYGILILPDSGPIQRADVHKIHNPSRKRTVAGKPKVSQ